MVLKLLIAFVAVMPMVAIHAQAPAFEVASIKLHSGPVTMIGTTISGTRITLTAYTLSNLVTDAYNLKDYEVTAATGWIGADRYDIAARSSGERAPTTDQVKQMLKVLLNERFQLKFHRETKEMPVYALVIAKSGPKLKENAADGPRMLLGMGKKAGDVRYTFTGSPMAQLVGDLSHIPGVDRPVIDQTALSGRYDMELNLATQPGQNPATGLSGESVFTAIEEQLGLKLESRKAPIEVLVIDHAERPSPSEN